MNNMTSITKQGSQTPIINAVRGDQNTRAFTFVVERYDGETDLAELVWVLQTKNAAGMTDATALYAYKTEKNVQLTWTIGGFATEAEGRTTLQMMGFDEDQTVQWSSGTYYMEVSRAISPDKSQTGATGQLKELVLAAAVRADEAAEGAKAAGEEAINIVRTEYERMQADVDAIKPIAVMQRTPMFPKQKVDGYIYNVLDNSTFGNGESYRGYAIYDVQAGETYLISGSSSANAEAYPLGAFWHDYSDWAFSFFGTDATKVYTDLVVTAPENATKMVVNLNSAYGVLKVDKQINLTQRLDIVMEQDYSARTLDGVITEAKKNPFAFKEYDKGYISFVFDDLPAEIDEIASIFEEYGMPLCLAAIPERLGYACEGLTKNVGSFEPGMSRGAVCAQVVNNGGEVLAHNSDVITAENQHVHEVMYNHFVKTKETLEAQGWPIRGIIRSGGEGQINKSAVIERWVTGNFEYSNYGYAPQHNLERETINQSIADLKAKILKAVNEKSWLRIMAHDYAFGGGTTFTGAADLRAILDYCKSVGIAVVTYAHMVDTFGCSELEKRVTAVEASAQQANEAARNAQTAADNAATEATKIATQAGQQAKETANNAVADLEDFKAGIEDEVSQLTEEIGDVIIKKTGKNVFFSEWSESGKSISSKSFGGDVDDALAGRRRTGYVKVDPNTMYTLSTTFGVAPSVYVYFYKQAEATEQSYISYIKTDYGFYPKTITTPDGCEYIRVLHTTEKPSDDRLPSDYQIEKGNVATEYEVPSYGYFVPFSRITGMPENESSYVGKNYLFLGDSITAMEGNASWVEKFKAMASAGDKTNVQAVGGATWCDKTSGLVYDGEPYNGMNHIGNQVAWCQKIGFASDRFDYIFISAGTNDTNLIFPTDDEVEAEMYNGNAIKPLADVDRSTWAGAIRWTVQTMRSMYPNAKIILVTPLQRRVDFDGTTLKDMYPIIRQKRETIIKMAKRMGVYYIDTAECDITNFDSTDFADNLHPSSKGAEKLANYIFEKAIPIICEYN